MIVGRERESKGSESLDVEFPGGSGRCPRAARDELLHYLARSGRPRGFHSLVGLNAGSESVSVLMILGRRWRYVDRVTGAKCGNPGPDEQSNTYHYSFLFSRPND